MPTVVLKLFARQGSGQTDGQSGDYMQHLCNYSWIWCRSCQGCIIKSQFSSKQPNQKLRTSRNSIWPQKSLNTKGDIENTESCHYVHSFIQGSLTHKDLGASFSPVGNSRCKSPSLENISNTWKNNIQRIKMINTKKKVTIWRTINFLSCLQTEVGLIWCRWVMKCFYVFTNSYFNNFWQCQERS